MTASTGRDDSVSLDEVAQIFVSIPLRYIPVLTKIYVGKLETGSTTENCLCLWIAHPDDIEKPFDEQRKRRGNQHPMCPVHTKEGLISGFLEFVYKNPGVCLACPWGCTSCTQDESDCECYEHQGNHPDNTVSVSDTPEDEFKCLHLDTRKGDVCQKCGVLVKRRDGND